MGKSAQRTKDEEEEQDGGGEVEGEVEVERGELSYFDIGEG